MRPANVAPWLEQVGDGLAKKVTIGLDAEISEVADCHQAAQERPKGAAQPYPVAGGDGRVTQDPAELLFHLLVGSRSRSPKPIPAVIGGFVLFLLFSYALSWGCGCLGIVSKGPESAQGVGLVILFPLAIVSNGLVPTQRMPAVLRFIADWNPVSAVTAAARHLWGNPNPSATIHAWPMQHPVAASLLWSVALLVIFAPLATLLYRRRTTG